MTPSQTPPRPRSPGAFLCLHPTHPPVENLDRPPLRDIKQEAALRLWLHLRNRGIPADDPIAAFDAAPALAWRAYAWACRDAQRQRRGYARHPRLPILRFPFHPDHLLIADPAQQAALDRLHDDHPADLARLWDHGIPGLTTPQTHEVILLLTLVQTLKARGVRRIPHPVRKRLWRLRRQTGLPLDTSLL